MPTQDPHVRNKNFEEVALGYTEEGVNGQSAASTGISPARPAALHRLPEFIGHVAEGDFEAAYQVIARSTPARRLRPCLPPGEPVPARAPAASRTRGIGRLDALWPTGTVKMSTPPHRARMERPQGPIIGAGPPPPQATTKAIRSTRPCMWHLHPRDGPRPSWQEIGGLKKMGVDF